MLARHVPLLAVAGGCRKLLLLVVVVSGGGGGFGGDGFGLVLVLGDGWFLNISSKSLAESIEDGLTGVAHRYTRGVQEHSQPCEQET